MINWIFVAALAPACLVLMTFTAAAGDPQKEQRNMQTRAARSLQGPEIPPLDARAPERLAVAVFGMG
jgi:hypothetical protein